MKVLYFCLVSSLFSLSSVLAQVDCLKPKKGTCDFYADCLEEKVPCGKQGYATGYGGKYCEKFRTARSFSSGGRAWVNRTMMCLQQVLVPFMQDSYDPSKDICKVIRKWAFDSHPYCYTEHESSFCFLSPRDIFLAVFMIGPKALLGTGESFRQVKEVVKICLGKLKSREEYRRQIQVFKDITEIYGLADDSGLDNRD